MTAKGADIGSKRLINLAPDTWARWLLGDDRVEVLDVISADFQWISRETDALIRARLPNTGEFLVLNELQLRYDTELPRRMRAYAALAEQRYKLPVFPVLVNILEASAPSEIPTQYRSDFLGLVAQQDYRVINLWEVDAGQVLADELLPLLPFVPLMRGGQDQPTLVKALTRLRAEPTLVEMESLLAFFARFVLDTEFIKDLNEVGYEYITRDTLVQRNCRRRYRAWFKARQRRGKQNGS